MNCARCDTPIPALIGRGRPRKYCERCCAAKPKAEPKPNARKELLVRAAPILFAAGWSVDDVAKFAGYKTATTLYNNGISGNKKAMTARRNERMVAMYREGKTLAEIGLDFDLTRERVRQILCKLGLSSLNGGAFARKGRNDVTIAALRQSRRDARVLAALGVDYETAVRLNDGMTAFYIHDCRARIYLQQKRSAHTRGVEWQFNFAEWCKEWDDSGKWSERGRHKGNYVMARKRDAGAYAAGNVRIVTVEQNIAEGWDVNPHYRRVPPNETLRAMQRRVYELRSSGKGHAEIAAELGITPHTSLQYCVVGKRLAAREAAA